MDDQDNLLMDHPEVYWSDPDVRAQNTAWRQMPTNLLEWMLTDDLAPPAGVTLFAWRAGNCTPAETTERVGVLGAGSDGSTFGLRGGLQFDLVYHPWETIVDPRVERGHSIELWPNAPTGWFCPSVLPAIDPSAFAWTH